MASWSWNTPVFDMLFRCRTGLFVKRLITTSFFHTSYSLGRCHSCILLRKSLTHDSKFIGFHNFAVLSTDIKKTDLTDSLVRVKRENVQEHLKNISQILNCSVDEVIAFCRKHRFLYEINLLRLQKKVRLLTSYGIPYSVIHVNLRIIGYVSAANLEKRLQLLQKLGILDHRFVGFYLHCTHREFIRGVNYVSKNQEALEGYCNQVEYVCYRLHVSESKAKQLLSSSPFQKGYTSLKLKKQLDFLLDEAQLSPEYIIKHYLLFNYSVERLRYRLEAIKEAGIEDQGAWYAIWRLTSREFKDFFQDNIDSVSEC